MIAPGMVAVRIAGRHAGTPVVVTEIVDSNFVMVDDGVKKKRCNIAHLELSSKTVSLKESAKHSLASLGVKIAEKKAAKKPSKKPTKIRKQKKSSSASESKPAKKSSKAKEAKN